MTTLSTLYTSGKIADLVKPYGTCQYNQVFDSVVLSLNNPKDVLLIMDSLKEFGEFYFGEFNGKLAIYEVDLIFVPDEDEFAEFE